jgi:hypothetical protein
MELSINGSERLLFEAETDESSECSEWSAALARLVAILRQRHTYEGLYGGASTGDLSPRTRAVSTPGTQHQLELRQVALTDAQQMRLLRATLAGHGGQVGINGTKRPQEETRANADLYTPGRGASNTLGSADGDGGRRGLLGHTQILLDSASTLSSQNGVGYQRQPGRNIPPRKEAADYDSKGWPRQRLDSSRA